MHGGLNGSNVCWTRYATFAPYDTHFRASILCLAMKTPVHFSNKDVSPAQLSTFVRHLHPHEACVAISNHHTLVALMRYPASRVNRQHVCSAYI
jgi:hypothetical protein